MATELRVEPSLLIEHARHLIRAAGGLETFAGVAQKLARRSEISLAARHDAELALEAPGPHGIARGFGEPQPAAVPCVRPPPLPCGEGRAGPALAGPRRPGWG